MLYSILADIVVAIHFFFIVIACVGAVLVLKWRWLIWLHIPAALWAAMIMLMGWICPLTPLENHLRRSAGQSGYTGGFIDQYLMPVIYPAGLTREIQVWLGVGVIILNLVIYTIVYRRYRREKK